MTYTHINDSDWRFVACVSYLCWPLLSWTPRGSKHHRSWCRCRESRCCESAGTVERTNGVWARDETTCSPQMPASPAPWPTACMHCVWLVLTFVTICSSKRTLVRISSTSAMLSTRAARERCQPRSQNAIGPFLYLQARAAAGWTKSYSYIYIHTVTRRKNIIIYNCIRVSLSTCQSFKSAANLRMADLRDYLVLLAVCLNWSYVTSELQTSHLRLLVKLADHLDSI